MKYLNHEFLRPAKAETINVSGTSPKVIDTKGGFAIVKIQSGSAYAAGIGEEVSATHGFVLDTGDAVCISRGIQLLVKTNSSSSTASATVLYLEND